MPIAKGQTKGSVLDIGALTAKWEELKQADPDDQEAQRELKQVMARLRRRQHKDLHPDCPDVEIDVPLHSTSTKTHPVYFALGNATQRRVYNGKCLVPRCVAHELLRLISADRKVDGDRMKAGGGRIEETGRISDIARQIAAS